MSGIYRSPMTAWWLFYDGDVRDAALYILFYNALTSQRDDFDLIAKLSKEYFKKYNKDKTYRKELTEMQK